MDDIPKFNEINKKQNNDNKKPVVLDSSKINKDQSNIPIPPPLPGQAVHPHNKSIGGQQQQQQQQRKY